MESFETYLQALHTQQETFGFDFFQTIFDKVGVLLLSEISQTDTSHVIIIY